MTVGQIPWLWLVTSACLFAGAGRTVQLIVCEGEEQKRALHALAGLGLGYLLFRVIMV